MSTIKPVNFDSSYEYATLEWSSIALELLSSKMGWKTMEDVIKDTSPGWEVVYQLAVPTSDRVFLVKKKIEKDLGPKEEVNSILKKPKKKLLRAKFIRWILRKRWLMILLRVSGLHKKLNRRKNSLNHCFRKKIIRKQMKLCSIFQKRFGLLIYLKNLRR